MSNNPYSNFNPEGHRKLWQACHDDMAKRWDPSLADGMTWEEFDEQSRTMPASVYLHYDCRQAPMFSEGEDKIIADAFGEDFAKELRDIHAGKYDVPERRAKKQSRAGKFINKLLLRD